MRYAVQLVRGGPFFVVLTAAAMTACAAREVLPSTGEVELRLTLPDDRIGNARSRLTNGRSSYGGELSVDGSSPPANKIAGVIAANGYKLMVTATALDSSLRCAGYSGPISVLSGKLVPI